MDEFRLAGSALSPLLLLLRDPAVFSALFLAVPLELVRRSCTRLSRCTGDVPRRGRARRKGREGGRKRRC